MEFVILIGVVEIRVIEDHSVLTVDQLFLIIPDRLPIQTNGTNGGSLKGGAYFIFQSH